MPLTETQLAYVAGIIDGEGCIRVNRQGANRPVVRVHVTNTSKLLVSTLEEWFGGYVWSEDKSYIPNAKLRYVWEVSAIQAEEFLRLVEPYLLLKKEQARIALQIRETMVRRGRTPVAPDVLARRETLAAELRKLNKKGLSHAIT